MDDNKNFMAWNSPGQGGNHSGPDPKPDQGQGSDPWGRRRKGSSGGLQDGLGRLFKNLFGGGGRSSGGNSGGSGSSGGSGRSMLSRGFGLVGVAAVAVVLGVYIFSGFYTVREAERGVVLRFGKVYDVVNPGLRWKFTGMDEVTMVDIEQVRAIQSSGTMLTEDENVVIVEMDVQYRISDPVRYLYSVVDPDNSLTEATDSALRYVVGHTLMDDILTSGREMVRQNTRDLLISIIEPYDMGLTVVDVNFLPARAPDQVKEAFDDAIAAQEDEQRYKREAEAYANEVLPRAEGQVQRILQEAEAYRSRVVLTAQGEVSRFEQVLPEYMAAPEITRKRMYLETMQEVLANSRKVIVDTEGNQTPLLYMPLPTEAVKAAAPADKKPAVPQETVSRPEETTPAGTTSASANTESSRQAVPLTRRSSSTRTQSTYGSRG